MPRKEIPRVRRLSVVASPPPEMLGCWKGSTGSDFEITANGFYYIIQHQVPYQISADGLHLNWDGWLFDRVTAPSTELVGVWRTADAFQEEYHFREDLSFTYHDPNSLPDLFGTYQATATELGTKEIRAVISIDGNELDLDPVFYPSLRYEWVIQGGTMTWTDTISNQDSVFTRVACP